MFLYLIPKYVQDTNMIECLLVYDDTNLKMLLCEDCMHKTDLLFYMH